MTGSGGLTAAEVAGARIPVRRLRARYDIADVDAFLEDCGSTLQAWEDGHGATTGLSADDVVRKRFRSAGGFTPGYDADAVDDLLDRVAVRLRAHAG